MCATDFTGAWFTCTVCAPIVGSTYIIDKTSIAYKIQHEVKKIILGYFVCFLQYFIIICNFFVFRRPIHWKFDDCFIFTTISIYQLVKSKVNILRKTWQKLSSFIVIEIFNLTPPPWNLQSLITMILLEMQKISYFSYFCTSTVIRQTESIHKITIK